MNCCLILEKSSIYKTNIVVDNISNLKIITNQKSNLIF